MACFVCLPAWFTYLVELPDGWHACLANLPVLPASPTFLTCLHA
jgi:hypothetical protein